MAQDQLRPVATDSTSLRSRVASTLSTPVDAAVLAYFRIAFGLVVAWEAWRYLSHGWVERFFMGRPFLFTYWPLDFVKPWPGSGMKLHFILWGIAGLLLALGLFYRFSAVATFLGVSYFFLLDKANYLNHIYLACLIAFLMIFLPAHRYWSIDALRKPQLRTRQVPGWTLWLLRFQLALPYFFGGIAKLNQDWFRGEPLRTWLARDTDFPLIGHLFTAEPMIWFMAVGALLLDLSVVFLLLNRRTRPFAYSAAVVFHFMNSRLFNIGIFPWLMIAATAIFFPPDWPRRVLADLRQRPRSSRSFAWWIGFSVGAWIGWTLPSEFSWPQVLIGGLGAGLALFSVTELFEPLPEEVSEPAADPELEQAGRTEGSDRSRRVLAILLSLWVGVQVLLPLRHLLLPGNVYWTEEGQRFSWMMLVRGKQGEVSYVVTDADRGETWEVDPADYLTPRQLLALRDKPDMMVQFAHYLRDRLLAEGYANIEVRARTAISLNSAPPRPIIDPNVDLGNVNWPWFGHADWMLP